ncbi:MAG: glycosyltransferase, partial [Planctomycetota bacterium]
SADAVAAQFPEVNLIRRDENEGVWARSLAFAHCAGRYVVLLDDDSYPAPPEEWEKTGAKSQTVSRSIGYLDANPRCAAVVGRCVLPSGRAEACALPGVMLSGAVCLRRRALEEVGGFRKEFFRKAGEYDLSYRLWQAGWSVERFEDLEYRHDKFAAGRSAALAHQLDLRNNLILVERFLPREMRTAYRRDTLRRYLAIARHAGHLDAARQAIVEARDWARRERERGRPETLDDATLEKLFARRYQKQAVALWSLHRNVRRVVIADVSKNLYATWAAARDADLEVVAIADDRPAFVGTTYRGVPVVGAADPRCAAVDGVIVSNINPAQIDGVCDGRAQHFDGPILRLWEPRVLGEHVTQNRRVA